MNNNDSKKGNDKVYVYDLERAYWYIENGIRPIEVPREHLKTRRVMFVFSKEETNHLFTKWLNRDR